MKKIDLSNWKDFTIENIFPNIITPKVYHTREVVKDDSGIPYVVRSKYNNGIKYRVKKDGLILNPAGVISYGAENAKFFYQKEEYVSGRDMYYIDTRSINKDACLFVCACLNTLVYKYSYNFGLFPKLLKKESIKLPTDKDGNPDWDYMASFIHDSENRLSEFYDSIVTVKSKLNKIDITKWGKFQVGLLLDCDTTSAVLPQEIEDGERPYITRSAFNNGCSGYIKDVPGKLVSGNCITIGAEGKIAFYQPNDFYAGIKVYQLRHPKMNKNIGLFLCAVLNANASKYSYNDARILDAIKLETIYLPIDSNEEPNWEYMEKSIDDSQNVCKKVFDNLLSIKGIDEPEDVEEE